MTSLSLFFPVIASLLTLSDLKAQEVTRPNALFENNLKGQVRAVTTKVYSAVDNFGKITKGRPTHHSDNSIIRFDRNGNLIEQSQYDINGGLKERKIWLYDKEGNKVEERLVFGIDHTPFAPYKAQPLDFFWKHNYSFDDKGRVRYSISHYRGTQNGYKVSKVVDSLVYEYYPTGTLMLKKSYRFPTELINRLSTDIYDVMVNLYDSNGRKSLSFRCTEIYEDLRPQKSRSKTDVPSLSAEDIVFDNSFDAGDFRGKLIGYSDTTFMISYMYKNSLLVQEVWNMEDSQLIMVIDYNDNGDLIRESVVGGNDEHVYSFTYPSHDYFGNWISKIKFENGVARYLYEREIKYY